MFREFDLGKRGESVNKTVTNKEAVIAINILNGKTLSEVAEENGIRIGRVISIVNRYCRDENRYAYMNIKSFHHQENRKRSMYENRSSIRTLRLCKKFFINPQKNLKVTYSTPIESLNELSDPTVRFLRGCEVKHLQDLIKLVEKTDNKVLALKSEFIQEIGQKKIKEILDVAKKYLFQ